MAAVSVTKPTAPRFALPLAILGCAIQSTYVFPRTIARPAGFFFKSPSCNSFTASRSLAGCSSGFAEDAV